MDTRHVETQTPDKHRCRAATALLAAVPCLTHTRTHYICILLPPALEAFPLHGSALAPAATPGGGGGGGAGGGGGGGGGGAADFEGGLAWEGAGAGVGAGRARPVDAFAKVSVYTHRLRHKTNSLGLDMRVMRASFISSSVYTQ